MSSQLQRARAALAAQDYAAARDALVAAWRKRRSPVLASFVDVVAAHAPDTLTAQLAGVIKPRVAETEKALAPLHDVDDPRVARFAIDRLLHLPFTARTAKKLLHAFVDIIRDREDTRVLEHVDAIVAGFHTRLNLLAIREGLEVHLRRIAGELKAPATPAADLAIEREIARALEPLQKTTRSIEALLADVYANPEDDGPRVVLADLLLEQGDPRGELITLQLERGDGEPTAREQELLKRHGKQWLGTLAPVLSWGRGYAKTTFRRGFVSTADIILSVGKKLEPIRTNVEWSTVEILKGWWDDAFLETAPLRALRVIERAFAPDDIAKLEARRVRLPSVRQIRIGHGPKGYDRAQLRAVFTNLETLETYWHGEGTRDLDALGSLGVEHVAITHHYVRERKREAAREFAAYVDKLVGSTAPMARLSLSAPGNTEVVELRRDARGKFERVS